MKKAAMDTKITDLQDAVAYRGVLPDKADAEIARLEAKSDAVIKEAQLQARRVRFLIDRVASLETTILCLTRLMTEFRRAQAERTYDVDINTMPSIFKPKPSKAQA